MTTEQRSNEPRRPRLVIKFDQRKRPASVSQRGRRWPKLLAVLGIIIAVIAVTAAGGVYLWWQHYKKMPAYSLALLVDASQRNDVAAVDQVVDNDKIVANLAAQVTEKAAARYGSSSSSTARRRVEALVSDLLPGVKQNVRDEVVKGVREISEGSKLKPFVVLAIGLPYLVKITAAADSVQVTANASDRQIELTMQRAGERWKVTSIRDNLLVQRIVDDLIKDLPAIGQELEELGIAKRFSPMPKSKRQRR